MSTLILRTIQTPDNTPVSFPHGIMIGTGAGDSSLVNNIGIPGYQGFGVAIAPSVPDGISKLSGTTDNTSDNHGNYIVDIDGSIESYISAFYYKWGTGTNGLVVNGIDIQPFGAFDSVAAANAYTGTTGNGTINQPALNPHNANGVANTTPTGYALHRAFYNKNSVRPGFFADKYLWSKHPTQAIASSLKNGNVIASAPRAGVANSDFASVGAANIYGGAIDAAKTRNTARLSGWHAASLFERNALAMLAYAHARAAEVVGATYCGFYKAGANFPKGNNANSIALTDVNDNTIAYLTDGATGTNYSAKTGSANFFNRTTHNGQNSGIADLNGNFWEITPGLTSDGTNLYLLSKAFDIATLSSETVSATDAWEYLAADKYINLLTTYEALTGANRLVNYGANGLQVFSAAISGTAWEAACAGVPLATAMASGGANTQFGADGLWDYKPNQMCPLAGGTWSSAAPAGAFGLNLGNTRSSSNASVAGRSALYL